MRIHHAPWTRLFKTMWCKGQYAYELQLGPAVLQWFYEPYSGRYHGRMIGRARRLLVWRDPYWRR